MQLVIRPEAQKELLDAQAWYEEISPGLGFEFARAVDAAIAKILRMPLAFPRIEDEFRHIIIRKFPYSIIYFKTETEIIVVSCFHHRRKPGTWLGNLSE
jgi:plasmid stabilization system protein ParE